jgi:hypothetical protein
MWESKDDLTHKVAHPIGKASLFFNPYRSRNDSGALLFGRPLIFLDICKVVPVLN